MSSIGGARVNCDADQLVLARGVALSSASGGRGARQKGRRRWINGRLGERLVFQLFLLKAEFGRYFNKRWLVDEPYWSKFNYVCVYMYVCNHFCSPKNASHMANSFH